MGIDELIKALQKLKERNPDETVYMSFDNDKERYAILQDVFCDIVIDPSYEKGKSKGKLCEVIVLSHEIREKGVGR